MNLVIDLAALSVSKPLRAMLSPQTSGLARACIDPLKVDLSTVDLVRGFMRDVSNVGHYGNGNLEVGLRNRDDLTRAQALITKSYDAS